MAYRFGDVLSAALVLPDGSGMKRRPVMVLHDSGDADLFVVPVPSHPLRSTEDIALREWAAAGLRMGSTVRVAKLATVSKTSVVHSVGRLSNDDERAAREVLSRFSTTVLR